MTCEPARERLRFALANLDVRRVPSLEVQLSAAVSQMVTSAKVSRTDIPDQARRSGSSNSVVVLPRHLGMTGLLM